MDLSLSQGVLSEACCALINMEMFSAPPVRGCRWRLTEEVAAYTESCRRFVTKSRPRAVANQAVSHHRVRSLLPLLVRYKSQILPNVY